MAKTYIDKTTDLNGNDWFINDVVEHKTACMNMVGKIAIIDAPRSDAVRVDFGVMIAPVWLSELTLVRRRTADEIPFAAKKQ